MNRFLAVFSVGIFLCAFVHMADAGESPEAGVQISPIRFDWSLHDGEERTDKIFVHNFSDISHDVQVTVEDFLVSDDSMQAEFYVPEDGHPLKAYDVINWIQAPDNFTIAPGETKELAFHVKIPEGQPTNGYYGTIFFKTNAHNAEVDDQQGGSVQLGVNYRVGALVTLAVQGDEPTHISGAVEDFSPTRKVFWGDTIGLNARLRSDGNIHYKAGGRMTINKNGKKFAVIEIEPEVLYPGKTRLFIKSTPFDVWDYGIYDASLHMQSEDGTVVFEQTIPRFYVFPIKTTAIIVGAMLCMWIAKRWFKKKFAIVSREELVRAKRSQEK